jgi:hypothetical protein
MAPDLSFNADTLQAKGEDAISLEQYCQAVGVTVVEALSGMAGAVGHPGLASALTDGAGQGDKAFSGMTAAYGHAYSGLVGTAQTLGGADQGIAGTVKGIGNQDIPFLNGIG